MVDFSIRKETISMKRTSVHFSLLVPLILLSLRCITPTSSQKKQEPPDAAPPVLTLNAGPDTIYVGDHWSEPGYTCKDSVDGECTDSVKTTGTVDTSNEGIYTITYTAADKKGNEAVEERTVTVLASPGLWAEYRFSGNADDASGSGRHARISGGAAPTTDRFGKPTSAYQFNGTDNCYIIYDNLNGFPNGNCPKTLSGWVRSSVATTMQAFVGIGKNSAKYNFQIAANSVMRINGWETTYDWITAVPESAVCNGKWHHLAVTYDSVKTLLYLDGIKKAETSAYRYLTDSQNGKVVIGNEIDLAGWPVKGSIDDVRIYTRALSALQVGALYKMNGWSPAADTFPSSRDSVTPVDTAKPPEKITGLTYKINGTSGSLSLTLEWNAVSSASAYGVYYDNGKSVTKSGYYRAASKNSYAFVGALTEGEEYTFAVCSIGRDGSESALSAPITLTFRAP
jgi:hypothetical protein